MTANPIELIGGLTTLANVPKADLVAWAKDRVPQVLANAVEVRNTTLAGQLAIVLKSSGRTYTLDTSDTTTADDGVVCIISNDGKRFKLVALDGAVNVKQYGAVCDGVTDDTVAFQAALNASDNVVFDDRAVVAPLTIAKANTRIRGGSPDAALIFKAGSTGDCINSGQYGVILEDFAIEGGSATDFRFLASTAGPVAPESNRVGVAVAAQFAGRIKNLKITGMGYAAIRTFDATGADNFGSHCIIRDNQIARCYEGIRIHGAAEYLIVTGNEISRCGYALDTRAGNINANNNKFADNGVAVYAYGGDSANNGHSNINDNILNHNVLYNIWADGITVGLNLIGNQMHLGAIWLRNSTGVRIANGQIQVGYWIFEGGGRNIVENNTVFYNVPSGLINQVNHNQIGSSDATIVRNNTKSDGTRFQDSVGALVKAGELGLSGKNYFTNSAMEVDQENEGATQTIANGQEWAVCVDQFYAYCLGNSVTGQQVAGSGRDRKRYRFTGAASTALIGFGQRIEAADSYDLNGQVATLSVDLANSLLTTVTWTAYYANTVDTFGTRASPTRTQIATGTWTVNSAITRYITQITVPSAATTGIEIVLSVGAQISGTWEIGDIKLEAGSAATPFERLPEAVELLRCMRYCEKSLASGVKPGTAAGAGNSSFVYSWGVNAGSVQVPIRFTVPKRTAATLRTWDGAGTINKVTGLNVGVAWVDGDSFTSLAITNKSIAIYDASSRAALCFDWAATARLF